MQCNDGCAVEDLRDGGDIPHRVIRELVDRRIGGIARRYQDDGVTIGQGAYRGFYAERAASAGAVVNDHLFAKGLA